MEAFLDLLFCLELPASIIALLDEPVAEMKVFALKKLNSIVDEFWPEISEAIEKIEILHEDRGFNHHELAALVASKVYYHLGSFEDSLTYALGAGELFDVNSRNEYVDTTIVSEEEWVQELWGRPEEIHKGADNDEEVRELTKERT
ncbi:hypothetical protein QAD02_021397 [Eretmocerus hayati]|uniref:Uncharacterized protein n=1 Tax=Eretmocerus hayati TaxID=131215 RepID=A0ACC2PQL9_9HYME|nr:hypothetical protein QAD02_021397 [Eretmocerus hayati]